METNKTLPIKVHYVLNSLQTTGKIVYEYNPFRNFRITEDKKEGENTIEGGTITDLDTDLLDFDLTHPVSMDIQPSYDGSVNVIFNDNKNIPRLINSRFSVLQNNTYEIVDRIGNNDTNIYDDSQFDTDSSLYKRVNVIPTINFNGILQHGNLQVGNYVIYLKYADADDNETDFIGETGVISCFMGGDRDPHSINGGFRDQLANKSISITVSNIDSGYDYIKVYYTRTTSDVNENRIVKAYKIEDKYPARNNICTIIITGDEQKEEIPLSDINTKYFIVDKAKTQVQCQNRLFLGNVNKFEPDHKDLQDVSLRILPQLSSTTSTNLIGNLNEDYIDVGNSSNYGEYYSTNNIYYNVGYWGGEIYRLGVVYIMPNGSLSPVYNIRGISDLSKTYTYHKLYNSEGNRNYIPINEDKIIEGGENNLENSMGVIRFPELSGFEILGLKIAIPKDVVDYLRGRVQGFFFVRQKRIPTILAQMFTLPIDNKSGLPLIPNGDNNYIERFLTDSRTLTNTYSQRLYNVENTQNSAFAGICPEYELRQPYFNTLFTGTEFLVKEAPNSLGPLAVSTYNERHYQSTECVTKTDTTETDATKIGTGYQKVKIISITDGMQIASVDDKIFRGKAGVAEEAWRVEQVNEESDSNETNNLVRGIYSAYLGVVGDLQANKLYNIYIPGYSNNVNSLYTIRYNDDSAYYAISDRFSIEDLTWELEELKELSLNDEEEVLQSYTNTFYRGDCYICNFTHRLNRNFQDPEAPTNDEIVDQDTWKENYSLTDIEKNQNINRGDVNAVQLGSWITLKVYSTYNLSIRSLDPSYPDEEALTGLQRGFFPLQSMSYRGNTKVPSSEVINQGYSSTVGERYNYTLPDVPYIKNRYDTRIMYSDISVGDAFKNGYRTFKLTNYRDYPKTYGGITTLVEFRGNIICVFEHGIAIIAVNERTVSGEGAGGTVYINTSNVLPENPKIISDTFGSQWPESVIKTPMGIYGVDTVGKKIWRTNGFDTFECISDFTVQEFLNQNITLTERESTPVIGVRNVKSHYNKYKHDVMFTFYDNLHGFEEKAWNLCYNELLQKWVTFYSWVPSYSANVYNQYFSFDRNTSKWIAKLGVSSSNNELSDGITLENNIISESKPWSTKLHLSNRYFPSGDHIKYEVEYNLERDNYGNYKLFNIQNDTLKFIGNYEDITSELYARNDDDSIKTDDNGRRLWLPRDEQKNPDKIVLMLNIKAKVKVWYNAESIETVPEAYENYLQGINNSYAIESHMYESTVAVIPEYNMQFLTTDFWRHGQAGIIDIADKIYPTYWYGKWHPFEFEFVVADNPDKHKIFNNLEIISNSAEPESFHYEIVGDCYDFAKDKKNMYIRQEATKELYQYNGCDVTYDHEYSDLDSEHRPLLDSDGNEIPGFYDRSTLMPLYYSRQDTINEIEDSYHLKDDIPTKDFSALAGGEIVHYKTLDEYRIWNHAKAVDMQNNGRLRGNMQYNEDKWLVQINPINIVYKNEKDWTDVDQDLITEYLPNGTKKSRELSDKVPIELGQSPIPNQVLEKSDITYEWDDPTKSDIPKDSLDRAIVSWNQKEVQREEAKLKDKWIKVRIRYTGTKLAVITAIRTLYSISYS